MTIFHIIVSLLFALPGVSQNYTSETARHAMSCKGVLHGIVLGQDGKPRGGINLLLESVGDYDYMLRHVRADQRGEYRFEEVCDGKWGVFVEDKEAGYPHSGRYMNWFLYGVWSPQVEITDKKLEAQLNVNVPPKPGQLRVRPTTNDTKAKIVQVEVQLKATRTRWTRFSCGDSDSSLCDRDYFLVPSDQNVKLHITSKGFHEWRESAGGGKTIRVPAGDVLAIDAELDPILN